MINASRRSLARYAVNKLEAGESPAKIAKALAFSLADSGKKKEAELLISDVFEMIETQGLVASATITTAKPLSAKSRESIRKQIIVLAQVKEVIIKEVIDETVIGGFRIETATRSWDKTIARKLAMIKGGI